MNSNYHKLKIIVVDDEQDIRETLVNTINESVEMLSNLHLNLFLKHLAMPCF